MHPSAMQFACSALTTEDVRAKGVLEAGALNVNGSVRPHVEALGPAAYLATDMRDGPGVDTVVAAEDLPSLVINWTPWKWDVVISMEMVEHARDWQAAMRGLIEVLAPGGVLVLTTRSEGFPYHPHPEDHWRFSVAAMGVIIGAAGLDAERLEADPDPASPGVFVKARKPEGWTWPDVQAAWDGAGVTAMVP